MSDQTDVGAAEPCPKCGRRMELVHFNADGAGLIVLHGPPPAVVVSRLMEPFTDSLVKTETGKPILYGPGAGHRFPARHCPHCHQIILRYQPG